MDLDVERLLGAVERSVASLERGGQAGRAVTVARSNATTVEDLWDAATSAVSAAVVKVPRSAF